ncbi:hypothetical protein IAR55_003324 [Kwoniella newhampshirensis]|uniref:Uncharacterized protein n=1 Tax=Kwoniella newhampshirensis TaxID=1651941 RepID=A0AAW0YZ91_9TREE
MSEAGPSTQPQVPLHVRKPKAPHPSALLNSRKRKLPPPLPPKPATSSHPSAAATPRGIVRTLPIKPLQGVSKTRNDGTKDGFGREVIFVTRKTGLGALMGRCRSLVVDEGYTSLRLHALGAAIPQALLLLYALLDLLPYPVGEKGMWYEIKTGSAECVDEIDKTAPVANADGNDKDDMAWLQNVGDMEEAAPEKKTRIKSTIQIDIHTSPRPSRSKTVGLEADTTKMQKKTAARNRPSKKRRRALATRIRGEKDRVDEEEMMNVGAHVDNGADQKGLVRVGEDEDEEDEEIEMVEER